jgi:hypothetical protein
LECEGPAFAFSLAEGKAKAGPSLSKALRAVSFPQKNFFGILLTTASGKLEKAIKETLTIDHSLL